MKTNLSILIIEDNPGDQVLLKEHLGNTSLPIKNIFTAGKLEDAFIYLKKESFSIIFLDLFLPDSSGLESFTKLFESIAATPVVILSGVTDTQVAIRAISLGAQDFLLKGEYTFALLEKVIVYSIERKKNLEVIEKNLQLLKASEESYRYLFDNNPAAILIWDIHNLNILEVNHSAIELYGYTKEEFLKMTVNEIWSKENENDKGINNTGALNSQYDFTGICSHINKNGEVMCIGITSHKVIYKGGEVILNLANNLTEKKILEEQLAEEKIKKQFEITDAVISAQEKERYFLGVELQDNINQLLATSKLYLECATSEKHIRKELVDDGRELLIKAMGEIRNLSHSLLPPSLEQVGLIVAFSDMIGQIEKTKYLRFNTEWDSIDETRLEDKLKLTIFRIVQEQVSNILKHAQATTVRIALLQQANKLELIMVDNGVGFDIKEKRNGVGLKNIESRAGLFNGKSSIYSKPGQGCTLHVVFTL